MEKNILKNENETDVDYIIRLVKNKNEYDLDYSELFKLAFGIEFAPDECRKRFYGIKMIVDKIDNEKYSKMINSNQKEQLENQLQELKKERMKISEERAALNRKLKNESNEESILHLIEKVAKETNLNDSKIEIIDNYNSNDNKVGLLTLSDIHYGLEINEFNNTYNPNICKIRFNNMINKIKEIINTNELDTIYILGLGDMIEGFIHNVNRIESRENVISQVINISEILSNFMLELSKYVKINYYDVCDNHGRIFENKENVLNKDNFSLFIKWYLKSKFENNERININENILNETIGTVSIFDRNYCFVHGHQDKISDVVQNLSLITKQFYDAIFIGHCHHFEANEVHGTYVYMNGTFAGTDEYANNLRKTSNPSQNLFIISKENGIECQYLMRI